MSWDEILTVRRSECNFFKKRNSEKLGLKKKILLNEVKFHSI